MRITVILFFTTLFSYNLYGQKDTSFDYLERLEIGKCCNVSIKYNKDQSKIVKSIPENIKQKFGMPIIISRLTNTSTQDFFIQYDDGPSADPTFYIYNLTTGKLIKDFLCENIIIPGNGYIYTSGHRDNMFNNRRKFELKNDTIIEVLQPFYYVGLKTKTLKKIAIYSTKERTNKIADLSSGYDIEVLLADVENKSLFLIKTNFGIVGWTEVEYGFQQPKEIDGLYFKGD